MEKPQVKTVNAQFSSGPCKKRPEWNHAIFANACLGRSHRSKAGISLINEVIALQREILPLPDDYLLAIVPGSDT
jgi:phosphoserine aminotransferase